MNLVAADVRRLILFRKQEVRASFRRLLQFGAGNARMVRGILTLGRGKASVHTVVPGQVSARKNPAPDDDAG
jgi:hypothetical protein